MIDIWVHVDPWDQEVLIAALEAGADAVIVPPDRVERVRELGRIQTVSENGDLQWERDVICMEVRGPEDEERAVRESRERRVILRTQDWRVIPLENLVARGARILVEVKNLEEAQTALGVLEKGVDGLILTGGEPGRVRELIGFLRSGRDALDLSSFRVERVVPVGMGDRVCIDTCSLMGPGQGGLVGSSSRGLFLMHAESLANPYVSPRPFRVNAGAVHAYALGPEGRTRYLSELRAGDVIAGVDVSGAVLPLLVGRVKIERRPMLLIEAEGPCGTVSTVCQNAETIRMVRAGSHEAVSVISLNPGDEVLGHAEEGGRHFGHIIQETILER